MNITRIVNNGLKEYNDPKVKKVQKSRWRKKLMNIDSIKKTSLEYALIQEILLLENEKKSEKDQVKLEDTKKDDTKKDDIFKLKAEDEEKPYNIKINYDTGSVWVDYDSNGNYDMSEPYGIYKYSDEHRKEIIEVKEYKTILKYHLYNGVFILINKG